MRKHSSTLTREHSRSLKVLFTHLNTRYSTKPHIRDIKCNVTLKHGIPPSSACVMIPANPKFPWKTCAELKDESVPMGVREFPIKPLFLLTHTHTLMQMQIRALNSSVHFAGDILRARSNTNSAKVFAKVGFEIQRRRSIFGPRSPKLQRQRENARPPPPSPSLSLSLPQTPWTTPKQEVHFLFFFRGKKRKADWTSPAFLLRY